ncbi:MAG TPA: hypothetical protein VG269_06500 [Tepidisphaeraceae bacterium]|jgi:hypothetical protein|nr:hypothetical protein [Tepidisphaeraceae bacterium]
MANDETDLLAGLPAELDYIRDVALKYGNYKGYAGDQEKTLKGLSPRQLQEIRDVYQTMDERGDASKLSEWIFHHGSAVGRNWEAWREKKERGEPVPPKPMYQSPASALFGVFEYLGFKGVAPFTSGRVEYSPPLDWSKLPPRLTDLAGPVLKWRRYQSYDELDDLAKKITPKDLEELRHLARRIRAAGDEEAAVEWSAGMGIHSEEHPEAGIIYFFMRLLDEFVPADGSPGLYERRADDDPDLDDGA